MIYHNASATVTVPIWVALALALHIVCYIVPSGTLNLVGCLRQARQACLHLISRIMLATQ
jgi:hypothetical protein